MVTVHRLANSDAGALFALFSEWESCYALSWDDFRASMDRILRERDTFVLVASEGDAVIGYAQARRCEDLGLATYYDIVQFLVTGERRSEGVGKRLLEEIEGIARGEGISAIRVHSQVHRSRAHVFYERNGFEYYKVSKFYSKELRAGE